MTFEKFFREAARHNIIDFRLRTQVSEDRTSFYIHASNHDSVTLDFVVLDDELIPYPHNETAVWPPSKQSLIVLTLNGSQWAIPLECSHRITYKQVCEAAKLDPHFNPTIVVHPPNEQPFTLSHSEVLILPMSGTRITVAYTGNA